MHRRRIVITATILGYSILCGVVLGGLYLKATQPSSNAPSFWIVYFLIGLSPAVVVLWLPRIQWMRLSVVAATLAVELVALHFRVNCTSSDDCIATTLAATALPFVYVYCLISAPVSLILSLFGRGGS